MKQGNRLILIRIILNDNIIDTNKSNLNQYDFRQNDKNIFPFLLFLQIVMDR